MYYSKQLCKVFLVVALVLLGSGCAEQGSRATPTPTFDFGFHLLPRATPRALTPVPTVTPGGETTVSFSEEVQPILTQNCLGCHGGVAGLWLHEYEHLMVGGDNGAAVIPGDAENSVLYQTVEIGFMPPNAPPLSDEEVELIRRWIEEGAPKN